MVTRLRFGLAGLAAQTVSGSSIESQAEIDFVRQLAPAAEAAAFDGLWASEHHFAADGYISSPFVLLGALAMETETLELGTNVAVGPLYDPVRLAEDCALIDHLSKGRLTVGLGLGYRDSEFEALGTTRPARVGRLETCVDTLRRAWNGEPVTDNGVIVTPRPFRAGGPPILLGSIAEPGVRRARRIGDGWIAGLLTEPRHARKRIAWIDDEGGLDGFRIVFTFNAFVAAHDAWAQVRPGVELVERQYRDWFQETNDIPSLKDKPFDSGAGEDGRPPHFVAGTPEECITQLRPWVEMLGELPSSVAVDITVRLAFPGVPHEASLEAVRLFGHEIIPALRQITPEAAAGVSPVGSPSAREGAGAIPLRPLPRITASNKAFWTSGADGVLRFQRCQDCGYYIHPATGRCPICLGARVADEPVSGEGTIYSYTINQHAWYENMPPPYAVILVELVEQPGLRLTSALTDFRDIDVQVGMPVRVAFRQLEDVWLPLFEPTDRMDRG